MQCFFFFFFQAEDGIRDVERSRGLGDVYKRQTQSTWEYKMEGEYYPITMCTEISQRSAITMRACFFVLSVFSGLVCCFSKAIFMLSFSFIGLVFCVVYLLLMLIIHFRSPEQIPLRRPLTNSYKKLEWYTVIVYQISYTFNILITVIFWGYLFPFVFFRAIVYRATKLQLSCFCLIHILPFLTHVLELAFNNIRLLFCRVLIPIIIAAIYAILAIIVNEFMDTKYPMLSASNILICIIFILVALVFILGLQLFGVCITKSRAISQIFICLLYTSPSPRDLSTSRMPSSA
eukprot:TRINITY_DN7457_c0_g1_i2.p1 TRINITY_DN7457_c0_g1~~TRINITY_DN7457_c0_g1_i2.p1  ORF type:complete len:290 (+),score=27.92 TRINITY_DN7457_c0_g1_i2:71-940(+)